MFRSLILNNCWIALFCKAIHFCVSKWVGVEACKKPIPAVSWARAVVHLGLVPRQTRQTTMHNHTHTYGQFRTTNQPSMHISRVWEETRIPCIHRTCRKRGSHEPQTLKLYNNSTNRHTTMSSTDPYSVCNSTGFRIEIILTLMI